MRSLNEGRDYLSVKLDDPSFKAPIYANLVHDEAETCSLIFPSQSPPGRLSSASDTARLERSGRVFLHGLYKDEINMNHPREVQKRLNFPDCAVNRSSSI